MTVPVAAEENIDFTIVKKGYGKSIDFEENFDYIGVFTDEEGNNKLKKGF